jgi:hypothetical protein
MDRITAAPDFVFSSETLASSTMTLTRTIEYAAPAGSDAAAIAAWQTSVTGTISESLVAGARYRLAVKAVNAFGTSEASEELRVALGRLPAQPSAPGKVEADSSQTTIMLSWTESAAIDSLDIEGYTLYMDDGYHGPLVQLYNGRIFPQTLRYLATGLTTGLPYRFSLTAHNLNGASPQSTSVTVYACLRPSGLEAPRVTSTTRTTIGIIWGEPAANGCPVSSFTVWRNSGVDDAVSILVDAAAVQHRPSLREHLITGLAPTGATFKIIVRAHNHAGEFDSPPLVVVLAAVPDTPTAAPSSITTITSGSQLGVSYGPFAAS